MRLARTGWWCCSCFRKTLKNVGCCWFSSCCYNDIHQEYVKILDQKGRLSGAGEQQGCTAQNYACLPYFPALDLVRIPRNGWRMQNLSVAGQPRTNKGQLCGIGIFFDATTAKWHWTRQVPCELRKRANKTSLAFIQFSMTQSLLCKYHLEHARCFICQAMF